VELSDYREARERLALAGYRLRPEEDGWEAFREMRAAYAGRVNALATYYSSPPAQWIGEARVLARAGHGDRPAPGARRVRVRRPRGS